MSKVIEPSGLVLSLFPGIGLLDMAFEEEGFTVVRGPDQLWGGDIRRFHVPAGKFDGIIGGPPCQYWTRLMFLNPNAGKGLGWVVNEYARVVEEAQPEWFLMEEVLYAPMPLVRDYHVFDMVLSDADVGGVQPRTRRLSFGTKDGRMLWVQRHEKDGNGARHTLIADGRASPGTRDERRVGAVAPGRLLPGSNRRPTVMGHAAPGQRQRTAEVLAERRSVLSSGTGAHGGGRLPGGRRKESVLTAGRALSIKLPHGAGKTFAERKATVLAGHGPVGRGGEQYETNLTIEEMCEYQGLPRDFTEHMPFTAHGKRAAIGNGVPLSMGRAIAQGVRLAVMGPEHRGGAT